MGGTILIAFIVMLVIMIIAFSQRPREGFIDLVEKQIPIDSAKRSIGKSVIIDAIPLVQETPQIEVDDVPIAPVYVEEKPQVILTFDASVARNALMRSRDKRVFDAIANRTSDYYRPFYEEELQRNEYKDWWDDVSYTMNDSGESALTPERTPSDLYAAPWESTEVSHPRSI